MSIDLTVIVKDSNGKLFEGAKVIVTPGKFEAETNEKGEAKLPIDGANRYEVEVVAGDVDQTVPFYPTKDQDEARLEVNLQYFEQLEKNEGASEAQTVDDVSNPWYQVSHEQSGYLLAGAIVLLIVVVVAMRVARKKRERIEAEKAKAKKAKKTTKSPKSNKKTDKQ